MGKLQLTKVLAKYKFIFIDFIDLSLNFWFNFKNVICCIATFSAISKHLQLLVDGFISVLCAEVCFEFPSNSFFGIVHWKFHEVLLNECLLRSRTSFTNSFRNFSWSTFEKSHEIFFVISGSSIRTTYTLYLGVSSGIPPGIFLGCI